MISSIDGRLLVERWTPPADNDFGAVHGRYLEVASNFEAQGWMIGSNTMAELAKGAPRKAGLGVSLEGLRKDHTLDRGETNIVVAFDPEGRLYYEADSIGSDRIVTVLSTRVSDDYLAQLREDGISYVFAGEDGHDLKRAMDVIGDKFGIEKILLFGGGIINGAFLRAGLIDEFSVLIYPGIDGVAGQPSIIEYLGGKDEQPAKGTRLRHVSTETLHGGMVWLRYEVELVPEEAG